MKREILKNIYNVNVIDYNLRRFHGPSFSVPSGTTYNAYVIDDEDITLIDLVEIDFFDDYITQVLEILDGRIPKNLVINHSEPDHSSSFLKVMELFPDIKIYCSKKAAEFINLMYSYDTSDFVVVKTNDMLNIGTYNLRFLEMSMLHWPDSIATYLEEEKLLFSNDAFGQHIASNHSYDEVIGYSTCVEAAKIYYANIIMPMANILKKKLEELSTLEIEMIAPSHGVIWKKYVKEIVAQYYSWASSETSNKVVIVYDTMWGTTEDMATYIARKFRDHDIEVKFYNLSISEINDIMTEMVDAKAIVVGSPTIYGNMLPNLGYLFEELRVLKPKNKIGASFGSYGWASMANRRIRSLMDELHIEVVGDSVECHFKLDDTHEKAMDELVDIIVDKMNNESKE